jgi:non-specific serine/threonine protein kinase
LPGFYDEWVALEREHLDSLFEHHMARLMSLLQDQQRWLDVLDWGKRWIKLGQRPEPAYRALMSAHAAKGDMSKVAATYERCIHSLRELGIEPSQQTRALYQQLKAGKDVFEQGAPVALKEPRKELARTNLPVPITSFVGREKEVQETLRLLGKSRLVTLIGPGGIGKTRLAIESANRLTPKFKDGIWWVDLVGLNDGSLIPHEIAKALDVGEIPNRPVIDSLVESLQPKEILLVLDNCEHMILACAQLVDRLLAGCRNLRILATSREALDISSETPWPVPSLSLPDEQAAVGVKSLSKYESVRLFVERAAVIQPQFGLKDQNGRAITQICRRLSGMPLAIELAAARVKMMSVDEISQRLDDLFSLLTSGNRTALPRHQTLRAAIDWSYELLTDPERMLFRRLAVFAGGFTLAAAEAVCGFEGLQRNDVLDLLGRLVDKSLVVAEVSTTTGSSHYRLLETIRQYAREKSTEAESKQVQDRHLEFYTDMAEQVEPHLELINQGFWLDQLETELDNLRAGLDWALTSGQLDLALRLVGALRRFWVMRSHDSEGRQRFRLILEHPSALSPTRARLRALNAYFFLLWTDGMLNEVEPLIEEALRLGAELVEPRLEALSLLWAAASATERGDYPKARSLIEASRRKWQDDGGGGVPLSVVFLGEIAMFEGDLRGAELAYETAFTPIREAMDYPYQALLSRRKGQLSLKGGQPNQALTYIRESLRLNREIVDYRGTGACLAACASVHMNQGRDELAARFFAVATSFLETMHIPLLPFDQFEYERNVAGLRSRLDPKTFDRAWSAGRAMSLDQAVDLALHSQEGDGSRDKVARRH